MPKAASSRPKWKQDYRGRFSDVSAQVRRGGSNPVVCTTGLRTKGAPSPWQKFLPVRELWHDSASTAPSTSNAVTSPTAEPTGRRLMCWDLARCATKAIKRSRNPNGTERVVVVFIPGFLFDFFDSQTPPYFGLASYVDEVIARWDDEGLPVGRPAPTARMVSTPTSAIDLDELDEGFVIGWTSPTLPPLIGVFTRHPSITEEEDKEKVEQAAKRNKNKKKQEEDDDDDETPAPVKAKAKGKGKKKKKVSVRRAAGTPDVELGEGSSSSHARTASTGSSGSGSTGEEAFAVQQQEDDGNYYTPGWSNGEPDETASHPASSVSPPPQMVRIRGPIFDGDIELEPVMDVYELVPARPSRRVHCDVVAPAPPPPQPVLAGYYPEPDFADDFVGQQPPVFHPGFVAQTPVATNGYDYQPPPTPLTFPPGFFNSPEGLAMLGQLFEPTPDFHPSSSTSPSSTEVPTPDDGFKWEDWVQVQEGDTVVIRPATTASTSPAAEHTSAPPSAPINYASKPVPPSPFSKPFMTTNSVFLTAGAGTSTSYGFDGGVGMASPLASPAKSDWGLSFD